MLLELLGSVVRIELIWMWRCEFIMALRSTTAKHDDGVVHTKNNSSYKTKRINNSQFSVTSTPTSFCAQRLRFVYNDFVLCTTSIFHVFRTTWTHWETRIVSIQDWLQHRHNCFSNTKALLKSLNKLSNTVVNLS